MDPDGERIAELGSGQRNVDDLYEARHRELDGSPMNGSLMVDFSAEADIRNARFGARRVPSLIVREAGLSRPAVNVKEPDLRIVARLHKGSLSIGLDLSGESLHRRGYRLSGGLAPLKETSRRLFGRQTGLSGVAMVGLCLIRCVALQRCCLKAR